MAWYHWIAVYMVIAGAIIFTIIPDKSLFQWILVAALIGVGLLLGLILPHKEDKYSQKKEG